MSIFHTTAILRLKYYTQKTNQFNLTTNRYTENDIKKFAEDTNIDVYYLRLEVRNFTCLI